MNAVTYESRGGLGLLRIANPPVNALSPAVVAGLIVAFERFERDPSAATLVVSCDGATFVAGGDIASFDAPDFTPAPLNALLARIEGSSRPVVAALHGTVLGGGLELAMACHHRVALPDARFGQPEVKLGLLPGSLGTQRLTRLVGVPLALDLMLSGRAIPAREALAAGVIDEIGEGDPQALGVRVAERLVAEKTPPRRTSMLAVTADAAAADALAAAAAEAAGKPAYPALAAIVRAVDAAMRLPFDQGAQLEARAFDELRRSGTSHALRHLFFAERKARRVPGLSGDVATRPVRTIGIVGAGTMGGGIAMNFANAGMPVVIVETSEAALERGLALVRRNYEASAARGRLTDEQVRARLGLLSGSLEISSVAGCDLVIEAVFEDMDIKKRVCAQLGQVCKPGAIVATNTSTLDVDVLAEATGRPADFLGLHFFSPANVMRLLEVVRGARTAPDVLATALRIARDVGKVPVVSGVCYGFIGNRMLEPYLREAEFLLLEGAEPRQIDAAIQSLGLAMGPCRMIDMAGIDVAARVVIERDAAGALPEDPAYRVVVRKLFELGRNGQKTQAGYYRYEGRTPVPDPELERICGALAAQHGIARRSDIADQEIVERLMFPLINEGVRILDEGIAYRPGDIDVVWTAGYGFPDHKGGPMFMADEIGLATIVDRLEHHGRMRGDRHGYWTPTPLLRALAASGEKLGPLEQGA